MTNTWRWWPADVIARATGCPVDNVAMHWPLIYDALDRRGIAGRDVALGVLGTVAIETASTFQPVREAFWLSETWRAANLRYYPFYGRGYLQLTWESGYRDAGVALGLDLVGNPDLALDPEVSADILAWFWETKGVPAKSGGCWWSLADLCRARDWEWTRRVVQGGTAGLDRLVGIATALDAIKEAPMPETLTFNPDQPTELQVQDWTCSIRSTMWLLKSLGIAVTPAEAQDAMSPRYVTPTLGLLDATGAGIVQVLRDHWGIDAVNDAATTFDEVMAVAGTQPVATGLRNWGGSGLGHWSAVRRVNDAGELVLANPAGTGPIYGQQTLSRQQFDARGPASLVTIPLGEPVAAAVYAQPGQVGSGLLAMMTEDGTEPALPSTWLPLGSQSATVEECIGLNGVRYGFHLPTGKRWRWPSA